MVTNGTGMPQPYGSPDSTSLRVGMGLGGAALVGAGLYGDGKVFKKIEKGTDTFFKAKEEQGSFRKGLWQAIKNNKLGIGKWSGILMLATLAELVGLGFIIQALGGKKEA